jgi:hypothetical protein
MLTYLLAEVKMVCWWCETEVCCLELLLGMRALRCLRSWLGSCEGRHMERERFRCCCAASRNRMVRFLNLPVSQWSHLAPWWLGYCSGCITGHVTNIQIKKTPLSQVPLTVVLFYLSINWTGAKSFFANGKSDWELGLWSAHWSTAQKQMQESGVVQCASCG